MSIDLTVGSAAANGHRVHYRRDGPADRHRSYMDLPGDHQGSNRDLPGFRIRLLSVSTHTGRR